ncbi:chromosomal replication initiator DnaA [Roseovarius sp. D0-M9]|uniref:chromosomal replication initiator DnaA n=1 Tax=Roseovarius sp. D0-M9 TaxID=3127117 RepID=UPI0030100241
MSRRIAPPRQLSLDLVTMPAQGRDDFYVSSANATAVALIEGWQDWPARKLVLNGPPGSGKTHLVHVWRDLCDAVIVPAADLPGADIPALAAGHVAIEDADTIAGAPEAEEALFHLHNLALAEGNSLLITARAAPNHWPLALPDLASRMQATPTCTLKEPDDELLAAVLMKQMGDRQILPTPGTIPYLVRRMPRAFGEASRVVAALDKLALERRRPVTRALAAEALDELGL